MAEPMFEVVGAALKASLLGIQKTSGYYYDVGKVYRVPRYKRELLGTTADKAVLFVRQDDEDASPGTNCQWDEVTTFYVLSCLPFRKAALTVPADDPRILIQNRLIADVMKAIRPADSLGGARLRDVTKHRDTTIDDWVVVELRVGVEYTWLVA